jgi:hypothetical protein
MWTAKSILEFSWDSVELDVISSASLKDGCWYCLGMADTWDHIVPLSLGGELSYHNLIPCCRSCNSRKNKKPLHRFRADCKSQGFRCDFDTPEPYPIIGYAYRKYPPNHLFVWMDKEQHIIFQSFSEYADRVYSNAREMKHIVDAAKARQTF